MGLRKFCAHGAQGLVFEVRSCLGLGSAAGLGRPNLTLIRRRFPETLAELLSATRKAWRFELGLVRGDEETNTQGSQTGCHYDA